MKLSDKNVEEIRAIDRVVEEKLGPTFPQEKWKIVVWWFIVAAGFVCWLIYRRY